MRTTEGSVLLVTIQGTSRRQRHLQRGFFSAALRSSDALRIPLARRRLRSRLRLFARRCIRLSSEVKRLWRSGAEALRQLRARGWITCLDSAVIGTMVWSACARDCRIASCGEIFVAVDLCSPPLCVGPPVLADRTMNGRQDVEVVKAENQSPVSMSARQFAPRRR